MNLSVEFHPASVKVDVSTPTIKTGFENPIARQVVERDPYEGGYTVTPGPEAVVLATNNKRMTDNITVNPIPNNYGLITWNGSTITVS